MFVTVNEDFDSGLLNLDGSYGAGGKVGEVWFPCLPNLCGLLSIPGLGDKPSDYCPSFSVHKEGEEGQYVL